MIDYSFILITLYKNKSFNIYGYNYEDIEWNDPSPKPTKEELDSQWEEVQSIVKKQSCKNKAKELIAKYDFAVLPDRSKDISNIEEIISYRDFLLSLIKTPIENPEFPNPPDVIWK
jgi:hypothetical protein